MTAVFKTEQASAHTCGFKAGPAGVGVDSADVALCMVAADASGVGLDKPVGASRPAYQEIIQAVRDEVLLKPHHTGFFRHTLGKGTEAGECTINGLCLHVLPALARGF